MYKLVNNHEGQLISIQKSNEDGSGMSIPIASDNTDYQAYLAWVSQGNTPLPADE